MKPARVSLAVAIFSSLAVVGLTVAGVGGKIHRLKSDLDHQRSEGQRAQRDLAQGSNELRADRTALERARSTLAAIRVETKKASAEAAVQNRRAERFEAELSEVRRDLDEAQTELTSYHQEEVTPAQVVELKRWKESLEQTRAAVEVENKILVSALRRLGPEPWVPDRWYCEAPIPLALRAQVLAVDPKWHFVVLNAGEDQGVLEHGQLLVSRQGQLISKLVVSHVEQNLCVANVVPGWELAEVLEGDLAMPPREDR